MNKKKSGKEIFFLVSDVLFVLVLCFAVLLTTMLITKGRAPAYDASGYHMSIPILIGVFGGIAFYLIFMVKKSLKCYKEVESAYYESLESEQKNSGVDSCDSTEITNE